MSLDLALGIYSPALGVPEQPLTRYDFETAHENAGELLQVEVPAERAVWTAQVAALLIGGLAPAMGALFFHWSFVPMMLAIAIDDAAALLADAVRMVLGERAFAHELERRRLAANTWIIAGLMGADGSIPRSCKCHRAEARPQLTVVLPYAALGACVMVGFLYILFLFVDLQDLDAWPLLFLPVALRLIPAVRYALHARASRPSPAIMPSAWLPISASVLAIFACLGLGALMEQLPGALDYAVLYFGICALFAALLAATRRRREAQLRQFAARDIAPLLTARRTSTSN